MGLIISRATTKYKITNCRIFLKNVGNMDKISNHKATYNQHIKDTDMSLTFYTASNAVSPLLDASCEITGIQNQTSIYAMILADFK